MKTKTLFLPVCALVIVLFSFFASHTLAITPTLSLSGSGDGDSIQVDVIADPNKPVILYYMKANTGPQLVSLGSTNSSGSLSTKVSTAGYGINPDSVVHVIVNGQSSADAIWPYVSTSSMLSLSQTSLVIPPGQSSTITAANAGTNFIYLSSNSNPPVANVSISGNNITVSAINYGSTIVTVCAQAGTTACASAYVNVQNTGAKPLVFSQTNVSVAANQSLPITVYGGTGAYIVLNNSNSSILQANLSGNIVTLKANSSSGYSAVTVCSSNMGSCGIINANIGNGNSSGITLDQTTPSLTIGQSLKIPISGGITGTYSIFSNSDESIVRAEIGSDSLLLTPISSGTAIVTVCSKDARCAATTATVVNNYSNKGGALTLSQNNLWVLVGQAFGINISGGSAPYSVLAPTDNILSTALDGSILTITGKNPGSTSVNVCSAEGGCTALSVLVSGAATSNPTSLGQTAYTLAIGEQATDAISGSGGYYISNNTNQSVATVIIDGNFAKISALAEGNASVSICQNGSQCAILSITVSKKQESSASISLSQPSYSLTVGENAKLTISGSGGYYVSTNTSPNTATVSIFGDKAIVNALTAGHTSVSICQSGGQCANLAVSVFSAPSTPSTPSNNPITLPDYSLVRDSKGRVYLIVGNKKKHINTLEELRQYAGKTISNISDAAISAITDATTVSNTANNPTLSFSDNTLVRDPNGRIYAIVQNKKRHISTLAELHQKYAGKKAINISFSDLMKIPDVSKTSSLSNNSTTKFKFISALYYGTTGNVVKELQKRLAQEGFLKGQADGKYLTSTVDAVKKFQKSKGIKQTGNVGPQTMAALNE